jgi:hypothetical protein
MLLFKKKVFLKKSFKITKRLLFNSWFSRLLNSYSISKYFIEKYNTIMFYTNENLIEYYVVYPLLMNVINDKTIVFIILAFL